MSGAVRSGFRGRGMDFEEVRVYQPGDDPRIIDWRVTARRGHPYSKVFNEERERPVLIFVDQGATMRFGDTGLLQVGGRGTASALLSWAAHRSWRACWRPGLERHDGRAHPRHARPSQRVQPVAHAGQPTRRHPPEETPLAEMLGRLDRAAPTGASVIVVSDFYGLDDASRRRLQRLAIRCELTCVLVYDPLEQDAPPAGWYRVSDGVRSAPIWTGDDTWRTGYAEALSARREVLHELARTRGAVTLDLATNDDVLQTLQRTFGQSAPSTRRTARTGAHP